MLPGGAGVEDGVGVLDGGVDGLPDGEGDGVGDGVGAVAFDGCRIVIQIESDASFLSPSSGESA